MRYHGDCVSDINIAYIGGGSREWAWGLMSDLALEGQLSGSIRLYDIDHEAAYANEIIGNRILNDNRYDDRYHFGIKRFIANQSLAQLRAFCLTPIHFHFPLIFLSDNITHSV